MLPLRDHNPRHGPPIVTVALIVANVALFVYQLSLGARLQEFLVSAAFVPARMFGGGPFPGGDLQLDNALLSMFLHGGFLHIGGNMLFLWIFGDNIEDDLGHARYTVFYLTTGVLASLAHVVSTFTFGDNPFIPSLGASGAISGVMGGYLVMHPQRRVRVIMLRMLTTVPGFVAVGLWFLFQLISAFGVIGQGPQSGGGVAFMAHIGGFIAGAVLVRLFAIGGGAPEGRERSVRPAR